MGEQLTRRCGHGQWTPPVTGVVYGPTARRREGGWAFRDRFKAKILHCVYWKKIYFGLIPSFLYRKYLCIFFPFFVYFYFLCQCKKTKSNYCPFKFVLLWKKWCITFQYPFTNKNARALPNHWAQNFESQFWPSFSAGCRKQSWPRFPHCYGITFWAHRLRPLIIAQTLTPMRGVKI